MNRFPTGADLASELREHIENDDGYALAQWVIDNKGSIFAAFEAWGDPTPSDGRAEDAVEIVRLQGELAEARGEIAKLRESESAVSCCAACKTTEYPRALLAFCLTCRTRAAELFYPQRDVGCAHSAQDWELVCRECERGVARAYPKVDIHADGDWHVAECHGGFFRALGPSRSTPDQAMRAARGPRLDDKVIGWVAGACHITPVAEYEALKAVASIARVLAGYLDDSDGRPITPGGLRMLTDLRHALRGVPTESEVEERRHDERRRRERTEWP